VPNITGVYPVNAYCYYNSSPELNYPTSFTSSNVTLTDGTIDSFRIYDLDDYIEWGGDGNCNGIDCNVTIFIEIPEGSYNAFLVDARVTGRFGTNKNIDFNVWVRDFTNDTWHYWTTFTRTTPLNPSEYQFDMLTPFEINGTRYVDTDENQVVVMINMTDFDNSVMRVYHLAVTRDYNGSYAGDLRGNEELVVSSLLYQTVTTVLADEEIISKDTIANIMLLILAGLLGVVGSRKRVAWIFAAFLLLLWVILYSTSVLLTIIFIFMSLLLLYHGWKGKDD
jgi:hypothetical protein